MHGEDPVGADELIDAVARDLTRGEPSLQLRRRVRCRIATRGGRVLWPAWAGMAGAAVALMTLLVMWPSPEGVPNHEVAVAVPPPQPAGQTPSPGPITAPAVAAKAPISRKPAAGAAEPLEPIDPLVIEPMTMPLIAGGSSPELVPIEMDDLRIEPLQIE